MKSSRTIKTLIAFFFTISLVSCTGAVDTGGTGGSGGNVQITFYTTNTTAGTITVKVDGATVGSFSGAYTSLDAPTTCASTTKAINVTVKSGTRYISATTSTGGIYTSTAYSLTVSCSLFEFT